MNAPGEQDSVGPDVSSQPVASDYAGAESPAPPTSPSRQIVQPFIDVVCAPRALWGINLPYLIEGLIYFGILGYLAIYFSDFVFRGLEHADDYAHQMVLVLTAGITLSMFFLGFVVDKIGARLAILIAFAFMLVGRAQIAAAPTILNLQPAGLRSPLLLVTLGGILLIVVGYGLYQPAAYAAVRQYTTPKTAAMGFAMLYALMNLGGWLPTFAFLLRDDDYLGLGIPGTFWIYAALTLVALLLTAVILTRGTEQDAIARAKRLTISTRSETKPTEQDSAIQIWLPEPSTAIPLHLWALVIACLAVVHYRYGPPVNYVVIGILGTIWLVLVLVPPIRRWLARHPLADGKFFFFIFALIPVQTLFTYNWLVLPQYISRTYEGWIGDYFEIASNANPLLIFILVPIVTALSQKANVYNMMIYGTLIMALPAYLLAIEPAAWTLFSYILIMTVGEAMWQPRFLQYAAEIAPENRVGAYMGVAQFPWFLTKLLVPWLYSGQMMQRYCPVDGPKDTESMWFIYGCIAVASPLLLLAAKPWLGRSLNLRRESP